MANAVDEVAALCGVDARCASVLAGGKVFERPVMGYRRKHSATGKAVDLVPIAKLQNLGAASARWLARIGVLTRGDLKRMGPVLAYKLVRQREPKANRSLLWCLFAALEDRGCLEVTEAEKSRLLRELDELQ